MGTEAVLLALLMLAVLLRLVVALDVVEVGGVRRKRSQTIVAPVSFCFVAASRRAGQ
jgi:hypothetical protein